MYIFIIAGESSGDEICARLVDSLRIKFPDVDIRGMFGPKTEQRGIRSLWRMRDISVVGFIEVIPSIFKILLRIRDVRNYILKTSPDIVITIDSYDFCIRIAKGVKKFNKKIKFYHIVAPSVWAYMECRAKVISRYYDKLFCFLPFEPRYFRKYGLDAIYVGYPAIHDLHPKNSPKDENLIVITIGSRVGEVKYHLPIIRLVIIKLNEMRSELRFFIPIPEVVRDLVKDGLNDIQNVTFGGHVRDEVDTISKASFIIAKIGTNIVELGTFGIPMISYYFLNLYTSLILRLIIRIKFASLINIIGGKMIIPEALGSNMNCAKNANMIISEYLNVSSNLGAILKQKIEIEDVINSLRISKHPVDHIVLYIL